MNPITRGGKWNSIKSISTNECVILAEVIKVIEFTFQLNEHEILDKHSHCVVSFEKSVVPQFHNVFIEYLIHLNSVYISYFF